MRGIERWLAAILLAGAVGGTAVISRHAGSDPTVAEPVHLAAPPPGHLTAPTTVVIPALPTAPLRPAARKAAPRRRVAPVAAPRRIVLPTVTPSRVVTPPPPKPVSVHPRP